MDRTSATLLTHDNRPVLRAVGAKMRFTFERADVDAPDGEIVELDRPRVFAFRWGDDLLRWELVPEEGGCRLRFTQTFGEQGMWGGRIATARHAAGWELCLDALAARLDGRSWTPPEDAWFERHEGYMGAFGLAEGETLDSPDGCLIRFERDLVQPVATVWAAITRV